jgi:Nucleotide modification associated domain 1
LNASTEQQYGQIIAQCKDIFVKKTVDYGTAWRILRLPSITDQIYIKAQRIRSIQEKGTQKIDEGIESEFIGIINYCIMALVQIDMILSTEMDLSPALVAIEYDKQAHETLSLLLNKNHDYGEAWRNMRVSSITDIVLMKLLRTKQIEDNNGKTLISEGVDANYRDMINYSVFALILLNETSSK